MTIFEKIEAGEYKNHLLYPANSPRYQPARQAYRDEEARLKELFYNDLLAEFDVTNNVKAPTAYGIAWERGHASGYAEVARYFSTLVELIR